MAKENSGSSGKGFPLLAVLMIGIVLGLAAAGGIAWYITKSPPAFTDNVPRPTSVLTPDAPKPPPQPASSVAVVPQPASGADDTSRFEFYKVLTDGQQANPTPQKNTGGAGNTGNTGKPANDAKSAGTLFLQVGAFADASEADRMKAHLAMLGVEATVLDTALPDKTTLHRVRLGPYKTAEEMNKIAALLKQNDISSTPIRSQ